MTFAATNAAPTKREFNRPNFPQSLEKEAFVAMTGKRENLPPALSKHLGKLEQTLPSNGGLIGPSAPEEGGFLFKAYPATDISVALFDAQRAAVQSINRRPFARGKRKTGTRVTVGPSDALHPLFPLCICSSYVPAQHAPADAQRAWQSTITAGRGTAVSGADPLEAGNGEPTMPSLVSRIGVNWRVPSESMPSVHWYAIATILQANTIFAGNGEANASAELKKQKATTPRSKENLC